MFNTDSPLVSVIIPFLNGTWLTEAIESVINQSYLNWEIILIDDGSVEEHSSIARHYSSGSPGRILYTDHPAHVNKGVTVSRNVGVSLSKGSFIAFLDADDCWLPEKLSQQLELFKQKPEAAMICEASRFWFSWNNPLSKDVIVQVGAKPDTLYPAPELIKRLYPLGEGAPPCPTGIMIKKEAFERSGGFEESFTGLYQLYEDQAFLSKVYLREKVFISGTANNLYRKRAGSLTGLANDEKHYTMVRMYFLNWLEEYVKHYYKKEDSILQLISSARLALVIKPDYCSNT